MYRAYAKVQSPVGSRFRLTSAQTRKLSAARIPQSCGFVAGIQRRSKPALSEAERDRRGFDCSLTNDRQLITRDTLDAPKYQIFKFDPVVSPRGQIEGGEGTESPRCSSAVLILIALRHFQHFSFSAF